MSLLSYSFLVGLICIGASALVCRTRRDLSMLVLDLCLASCIAGTALILVAVLFP